MSDFETAVRQLGLPVCPHCGEIRRLEQISNALWSCGECSSNFPRMLPSTVAVLDMQGVGTGAFESPAS